MFINIHQKSLKINEGQQKIQEASQEKMIRHFDLIITNIFENELMHIKIQEILMKQQKITRNQLKQILNMPLPIIIEVIINVLDFGNAYVNSGRIDEAIIDCSKAIQLQVLNADAFYVRGNAYKNQGKLQDAIIDYSKAVEINPQHSAAYYNRGLIYSDQKIFDKAIIDYSKAIGISPANPLYWFSLGFLQFSLKQFSQANQYFESALKCSLKVSIQQRLQFQLSKDMMMYLHQKVEILSSINKELQIVKEEIQDLHRINIISQIQHQQYQFEINNIENHFLQFVPTQSNEKQVERLMTLKLFMGQIQNLLRNICQHKENQNNDLENLISQLNLINPFQQTEGSQINYDFQELKEQMSPDKKLYYRSLFWHLYNYLYAVNLISSELVLINIESSSVQVFEILQQIKRHKDQVEGYVPIIGQTFEILNSALDQGDNINEKKFESRINALKQILQAFSRFTYQYEREIESASVFMAYNINFYFEQDKMNTFSLYVERISILEFEFEQYSENKFWKTGILHTLIILKYLIDNSQQIANQFTFRTFKDILIRSIIEFNTQSVDNNKKQNQEGLLP